MQSRLQHLYQKLALDHDRSGDGSHDTNLNSRARAISLAFQRGLLNPEALRHEEKALEAWLAKSGAAKEPAKEAD